MRIFVAGTAFDNVTMPEAVARIVALARQNAHPAYVCTGNLDHLVTIQQDAEFRAVYDEADLVLADGMPVVWLSRLGTRPPLRERVAGSDLFWELARASAETGLRLFLLGGAPGAADRAVVALQARYSEAKVCGVYAPPFDLFATEAEQARISAAVCEAQPDVLLVAFGTPKQEKWIAANRARLQVPVSIGVGAGFDMAGGLVRRAPRWMQQIGMEWFYRLLQEPGRLSHRYLSRDLPFLVRLTFKTLVTK